MIVQPDLVDHPKYRRLKRQVGEAALEYVVRIWAHCQAGKRGEFWPGKTAGYVEDVACWMGESGRLAKALSEPYEGGSPWVVFEADGVRIHDWDAVNSTLIFNWRNGSKGGRPKKPNVNPAVNPAVNPDGTSGKPMGYPIRLEKRREEESTDARGGLISDLGADLGEKGAGEVISGDAHIPSVAEVVEEGAMRNVPADYCAHFHETHEADRLWLNGQGYLKDWRKRLRSWWVKDQGTWKNPRGKNGAGTTQGQREVLDRLEAALQVEQRPEVLAEIRKEIRKAKG